MDYIFKSDFLNFNEQRHVDYQYYRWNQKTKHEKEKNEYLSLQKTWFQIEEDERKEQLRPRKKHTMTQSQKQTVICKPEETYIKNMLWKHNVEQKIEQLRVQRNNENEQREFQSMEKENQPEKELFRDREHQGPIKAWKQRFDNYLRVKSGEEGEEHAQNQFHPAIDLNSRRITSQMVGKVQDRLLSYGQKLKEKKIELQASYEQELYHKRSIVAEGDSIKSELSDVFWRLYKDGEKMNKKRGMQTSSFSFIPEINQSSIQMVSRMNEKRLPLYQVKKLKGENGENENEQCKKKERNSEKGFSDFLKRNEVLLGKIENNKVKKMEMIKQKQQREINQCTFAPTINPKSVKIFANRQTQLVEKQNYLQQLPSSKPNTEVLPFPAKDRKMYSIRSAVGSLQSAEKQSNRTEGIQRLNSVGNIKHQSKYIEIHENDSISNDFQPEQFKPMQAESFDYKKSMNRSKEGDFDFLATDRVVENEIYNINEEMEEDSIEHEKDNEWQRELFNVERQIEEMMSRSNG